MPKESNNNFKAYNMLIKGIESKTGEEYNKALDNIYKSNINESFKFLYGSHKCICGVTNNNPVLLNYISNGKSTSLTIGSVCINNLTIDIINNKDNDKQCEFWLRLHNMMVDNDKKNIEEKRAEERFKSFCNICNKSSREKRFLIKGICKSCRKDKKEIRLKETQLKQLKDKERKRIIKIANSICLSRKYYGVKIKDLRISYIQFCIKNQTKQANDYKIYYDEYKNQKQKLERISSSNKRVYEYGE